MHIAGIEKREPKVKAFHHSTIQLSNFFPSEITLEMTIIE